MTITIIATTTTTTTTIAFTFAVAVALLLGSMPTDTVSASADAASWSLENTGLRRCLCKTASCSGRLKDSSGCAQAAAQASV